MILPPILHHFKPSITPHLVTIDGTSYITRTHSATFRSRACKSSEKTHRRSRQICLATSCLCMYVKQEEEEARS
ncbi:hypothetical protein Hdeb2414_s0015g00440221 [Helianthus debilis subsp. tardiflorus]